ncbi:ABC transporter permease [Cellulomonas hominis]
MTRFLARRLISLVPILLGVAIVVFLIVKMIPGDPVASLLGPTATDEDRARLITEYGLDQPLLTQFFTWLGSVLQGNLGRSIARQQDAAPMVLDAMRNTLVLSGVAFVIALVGGVAVGALAAFRRGRPAGTIASGIAMVGLSAPQYSIALILMVYLGVKTGWFPTSGMYLAGSERSLGDLAHHVVLPAITAALVPLGLLARMFRSALLDASGQDWVEALHARGLAPRVVTGHILHNAAPSVLTVAGLQFGYLLSGVVFVETVFSWPGIGLLVYQAISQRDLAVIQAGVLVSALVFVLVNVAVDLLHGYVDPRVRQA